MIQGDEEAVKWNAKAAKQGHQRAQDRLKMISDKMIKSHPQYFKEE
ncbi:MAG: hypothetical protein NTX45_24000 [Proteobacteria bacterium]|nr:hypothetical protein [Pseudomonadota bacterium]